MHSQRTSQQIVTGGSETEWAGPVHRMGAVRSTMEEARRLVSPVHGTVVMAREQHAGVGRSGRAWLSPPGNLYATVVLRPDGPARDSPQLAFVVANAVAQAVDTLAGPGTALKWPNDVLRGRAKLAGILLDHDGAIVLAGIGMNVAHSPPGMPYPVTSLAALGCHADVEAALDAVIGALQVEWALWRTGGFARVLDRWAVRGPAIGSSLVAQLGAERVTGRFAGLRDDGALLLDTLAGRRSVVAGDVQPCNDTGGKGLKDPC